MDNQLIPMSDGDFPVDSRDLAEFLGQTHSNFARYLTGERGDYGFEQGIEFIPIGINPSDRPSGGRPGIAYKLSINCAKELAMLSGTERGKQARAYFLECERRVLAKAIPQNLGEALRLAADEYDKRVAAEQALAIAAPKVAFAEAIEHADQNKSATDVAKLLGIQPYKLLIEQLILHNWYYRGARYENSKGVWVNGALRGHSYGISQGYVVEKSEMHNGKEIQCPRITVKGRGYLIENMAWGLMKGLRNEWMGGVK